jgi:diguanylate cyclase (GGDEF)-like protein
MASFEDQLRALRHSFVERLPAKIAEVEATWQTLHQGRWDKAAYEHLHQLVHSLAGSGGTFGYTELSKQARALEQLLQALLEHAQPPTSATRGHISRMISGLQHCSEDPGEPDPPSCPQPDGPSASPQPRLDRSLIHVVEPDAALAQNLVEQLGHYGYAVRVFTAVAHLKATPEEALPAAVILDMVSSEQDIAGAAVLRCLRRRSSVPLPIIFIAVRDDLQTRLQAVRAGGEAYFTKPVDVSSLVNRLDILTGPRDHEPYRILVVDDDEVLATHYQLVLRRAEMQAHVITQPAEVMTALVDFKPELILMDVYMPGCSGLELAKVIRQQEAYLGMPIVFLSTEHSLERQFAALHMGGDDFLTKPIRDDHLVAAVHAHVQRARLLSTAIMRDSLTGLLNHRKLREQLDIEVAQASRQQGPLSFAMIDLDHFKAVNDTYGHLTGDRVLKSLARLLQQRLRRTDSIARCGGEEFAVIFPFTDEGGARTVLEELRQSFARLPHNHEDEVFTVTFSCGFASYPRFQDAETLYEAADQALYEAKRTGRNRLASAGRPATS